MIEKVLEACAGMKSPGIPVVVVKRASKLPANAQATIQSKVLDQVDM